VNEDIRVPQVRLIDQDGEMQGVMTAREAIQRAFAVGLDLLEISPNADPPVVKILDFGKYKYEQQKKKNEARKKQKVIEIKEIKVRPNIDENDYQGQGHPTLPRPRNGAPGNRRARAGAYPIRNGPGDQGRADAADGKSPDGYGAVAALTRLSVGRAQTAVE